MFFVQQINMLEWFWRIMKTRVMAAENSALPSQEYITFEINKNKKCLFQILIIFHDIVVFAVFS